MSVHRVLAVDDNRINRLKMARALKGDEYEVTQAEGGKEALDLLRARRFDLVLLDLEMPDVDGFEVLRQLAEEPTLRDIPVIIVSGVDDSSTFDRCLDMGAVDHIGKPFDLAELRAKVESQIDAG